MSLNLLKALQYQAQQALECLEKYDFNQSLSTHIMQYQKNHKKMGKRDRLAHKTWIYELVRWRLPLKTTLQTLNISHSSAWNPLHFWALASWVWKWNPTEVENLFIQAPIFEKRDLIILKTPEAILLTEQTPVFTPDWLGELTQADLNQEEILEIQNCLKHPPQKTVILHPEKTPVDHTWMPSQYSKINYYIVDQTSENFFEKPWTMRYQNEGSSIISLMTLTDLPEKRPLKILDLCAGEGGKSHVFQMLIPKKEDIQLFIWDNVRYHLIEKLVHPSERENIKPLFVCPPKLPSDMKFDLILCDVPCSQSGLVRRLPELTLVSPEKLYAPYLPIQKAILQKAVQHLAPLGIIVYSTCSIFSQENLQQIDWFLKTFGQFKCFDWPSAHPMTTQNFSQKFSFPRSQIQLFPQIQACDGFFMARLKLD